MVYLKPRPLKFGDQNPLKKYSFCDMSTVYVGIDNNILNGKTLTRIREINDFVIKCDGFKDYDFD